MQHLTPIEQIFANRLKQDGVAFEPQKELGWVDGGCSSQFPCTCGEDQWINDGFIEGQGDGDAGDCPWYKDGYAPWRVDFFIPAGRGIVVEIDDWATHGPRIYAMADRRREDAIRRQYKYLFVRFRASDVYSRIGKCMRRLHSVIKDEKPPLPTTLPLL